MELIDYYREIQLEASKDAYKSTCHYLTLKSDNPVPHGSGVFIQVASEKFLITAAHVVDNKKNEIYVGIGEHDIICLGGESTVNQAPGLRDDDRIDLSILKLNNETIVKLGDQYQFLNQNELGINHDFKLMPLYQSVGFPASKSKYNRHKDELKSTPFLYTTMPAEQKIYNELGCKQYSNFIVQYDKKKVMNYKTNQLMTGPDPYGISGSGLWFIPPQLIANGEKIDKKLVGIMTEWPRDNRKYWIGTRIDIFTEIIRQIYNLDIEKSKVVKVNL